MRTLAALVCAMFAVSMYGASPEQSAKPQVNLTVDNAIFNYEISHPELVGSAWVEVRDEPLLLDKKSIAVQGHGQLNWDWDRSKINPNEESEDELTLSIWDPNGATVECEGTVMSEHPGGLVSSTVVGGREKFTADGIVGTTLVRIAKDEPNPAFDITGLGLGPGTQFYVNDAKGVDCKTRLMQAQVSDLVHAKINLDPACSRKPGLMSINTENKDNSFDYDRTWVLIASPNSPVLRSISPAKISIFDPLKSLRFVLHGSGFAQDSSVFIGELPDFVPLMVSQLVSPEVKYVSPTKLVVTMSPGWALDNTAATIHFQGPPRLRFWVIGKEGGYEVSKPFDVGVDAASEPTALITGVSPFPVPLMKEHGPSELKLTIRGEDFRPENKVHVEAGHYTTGDMDLRTQYVSSHLMYAWLPRQLWRKHKFTYTLVVETNSGERISKKIVDTAEQ